MASDLRHVPDGYRRELDRLAEIEERLDAEVRLDDQRFAGLRDYRTVLELATVRLHLATLAVSDGRDAELARAKALAALQALDDLRGLSLSDDQSELIRGSDAFVSAQEQLDRFLMAGGGVLLEDRVADVERCRKLARIVASAVSKHAHRDDTYRPLFRTEKLPEPVRTLVNLLLPVLAPENQAEPPYGLEEGEEEVRRAPRMTVPLPQAIHYLEEEVLPAYRDAADATPGDAGLQASIATLEQRIERLQALRVYPRSTPLPIEPGIQTDTLVGFTAEGVPLVTLGIGLLLLAWLESTGGQQRLWGAIQDFGSVPLFLYVVHLYVLLAAYWVLFLMFGATHGGRFGLSGVAWIWAGAAALVLAHYPIARAFASYKHREKRNKPWLSYL